MIMWPVHFSPPIFWPSIIKCKPYIHQDVPGCIYPWHVFCSLLIRICPRHPRLMGIHSGGSWLILPHRLIRPPPVLAGCVRLWRRLQKYHYPLRVSSHNCRCHLPFDRPIESLPRIPGSWRVPRTCSRLSPTSQRRYLMNVYSVVILFNCERTLPAPKYLFHIVSWALKKSSH